MSDTEKGAAKGGPVRRGLRSVVYASIGAATIAGGYLREFYGRSVQQGETTVNQVQASAKRRGRGLTGRSAEDQVSSVKDAVSDASETVAEKGGQAADTAKDVLEDASKAVSQSSEKAADAAQKALDDMSGAIKDTTN